MIQFYGPMSRPGINSTDQLSGKKGSAVFEVPCWDPCCPGRLSFPVIPLQMMFLSLILLNYCFSLSHYATVAFGSGFTTGVALRSIWTFHSPGNPSYAPEDIDIFLKKTLWVFAGLFILRSYFHYQFY